MIGINNITNKIISIREHEKIYFLFLLQISINLFLRVLKEANTLINF